LGNNLYGKILVLLNGYNCLWKESVARAILNTAIFRISDYLFRNDLVIKHALLLLVDNEGQVLQVQLLPLLM